MNFSSCHVHYIFHPSHPPRFAHPNNIQGRVQTMKLPLIQFSPSSCYFLYFTYNLSILFSDTPNLSSVLRVTEQVPHPYKITHKNSFV
jgi:hypothetical protein